MRLQPHRLEPLGLPLRDRRLVEPGDRVLVHAVKIEPRPEAQESAAEADGGALEKYEFARNDKPAPFGTKRAHDCANLAPSVFGRAHAVGRGAHTVVEDRAADEA